jgi:TPR repeat protein
VNEDNEGKVPQQVIPPPPISKETEDAVEAVRLYRLAADQGYVFGQSFLGVMYMIGEGVPEDPVLAYMWFNLAAAQGNETAQSNKAQAESRMTREQIAEAQRLSREWLEAHPPGGN